MLVGRDLPHALQRRGGRALDGMDHAGDIAPGRGFAPALRRHAPRLAVEISDEDVVLDDQDLFEVEVAVLADTGHVAVLWRQRPQNVRQG